jgi:hypothetical protein
VLDELVREVESGARFATIGLTSRWAESMELLDRHVPLARPWASLVAPLSEERAERERHEEAADVEAARADPVVLGHLAADIALYNAATRLFARQLRALRGEARD